MQTAAPMESIPGNNPTVLVVDDDPGILLSIKATLISSGLAEPALVADSRKALDLVRKYRFHLVLLDLMMPHKNGLDLLTEIKQEFPFIECIIVSAVDEIPTAIKAMRYGAYDYLVKPINSDRFIIAIRHALERYSLRHDRALFEKSPSFSELDHPDAFMEIVAEDRAMARVFHQVEAVAPTDYSVVISGESGTGKEKLSRVIHDLSNRAAGPFVAVNMAAFSKSVFEAEFFGHTRGAFTDAARDKAGFFETADQGSLFLDEIAELEMPLQSKLLRIIEEGEFYRLGSTRSRTVDVRIIAATNKDMNTEIHKGQFRSDLYYRLNMYHIKIPPLRKRRQDILPLARHFLRIHAGTGGRVITGISRSAERLLMAYHFPGNVRELENMIAAAVLREKTSTLSESAFRDLLSPDLHASARKKPITAELQPLVEIEKQHIRQVLEYTGWNRKKAAKILQINTTTVYRKMQKYDIREPDGSKDE